MPVGRQVRTAARHRPPRRRASKSGVRPASACAAGCCARACTRRRCSARRLRAGRIAAAVAAARARAPRFPRRAAPDAGRSARHPRRMLVLAGCVQPALAPIIDAAMARALDRVGISLVRASACGCCGALARSSGRARRGARDRARATSTPGGRTSSAARGDRRHGKRVRRHGQGLRAPAARRSGVCGQGEARRGARARPGRGHRRGMEAIRARRSRWITGPQRSRSIRRARCSTA